MLIKSEIAYKCCNRLPLKGLEMRKREEKKVERYRGKHRDEREGGGGGMGVVRKKTEGKVKIKRKGCGVVYYTLILLC